MIKLLKFFFVLLLITAVWGMFDALATNGKMPYALNYPIFGWILFVLYHITGICLAVYAADREWSD